MYLSIDNYSWVEVTDSAQTATKESLIHPAKKVQVAREYPGAPFSMYGIECHYVRELNKDIGVLVAFLNPSSQFFYLVCIFYREDILRAYLV
jgi:hypothetical protein